MEKNPQKCQIRPVEASVLHNQCRHVSFQNRLLLIFQENRGDERPRCLFAFDVLPGECEGQRFTSTRNPSRRISDLVAWPLVASSSTKGHVGVTLQNTIKRHFLLLSTTPPPHHHTHTRTHTRETLTLDSKNPLSPLQSRLWCR